jgi:signal transduction histidine kinase
MIPSQMATVSGTSLDSVSAAGSERHDKAYRATIVAGLALCALYALLPERFEFLREELIFGGGELAAAALIVLAVRWYRPSAALAWLLIAAGIALWAIGDLIWGAYTMLDRDPFPSVADAFYLLGYPCMAAGLAVMTRRRLGETDRGALLDAVILTTAVGLLVWVYLIEPLRADAGQSRFETMISIAYPLGDLLLLAVAARLLLGGARHLPSYLWLMAALSITLTADFTWTMYDVGHVWVNERALNTIFLVGALCFPAAALHPSMRQLTERVYIPAKPPGLVRLTLIAIAALLPAGVLVAQSVRDEPLFLPAIVVTGVILFGAALLRWGGVVLEQRRAVRREAMLRRYATELLEATGEQELISIAERTAKELVSSGSARIVAPTGERDGANPRRLTADVVVDGEVAAQLVVSSTASEIDRRRDSLTTVAHELALALDRDRLLAAERKAATELADQNERLRELDEMKDQFVSTVSHELRTPLTSMLGYVELVLEGEAGELNSQQEQFLGIVSRNCTRLNRLIDDILFVARIDAGRLSLEPQWVALAELARAAVESAKAAADRDGVQLHFSSARELPQLWADPTRLTQMFDNLISNAVKFTPEGGAVTVGIEQNGGSLRIEVADTGVGIPEDEVGRLFERFFRASTSGTVKGTGLGLPIVKLIAEVHGGTISVESKLGVGTTFTIELPLPGLPGAPVPEPTEVTTA